MLELEINGIVVREAPHGRRFRIAIRPADRPYLKPQRIECEQSTERDRRTARGGARRNLPDERIGYLRVELVPQRSQNVIGIRQDVLAKTQIKRQSPAKFRVVVRF